MQGITAAILTIASIVAAVLVVGAMLPEVGRSSGAISASNRVSVDQIRSNIEIVYVVGKSDTRELIVWVKNVGSSTFLDGDIVQSDLILGGTAGTERIPYTTGTNYWNYVIEDSEPNWIPATTIRITTNTGLLLTPKAEDGEIDESDANIAAGTLGGRRGGAINGWSKWGIASPTEYDNTVTSDDLYYQTADPGKGDNAAIIFENYTDEDPATVTQIDVSVEISRNRADKEGYVHIWNYITSSYLVCGSDTGSADAVVSCSITVNPGDYLDPSTGQFTVFVVNQDTSEWIRVDQIFVDITTASGTVTYRWDRPPLYRVKFSLPNGVSSVADFSV